MEPTLLQELSNPELDWLLTNGERLEIASGTILLQPGQPLEALYILLDGTLMRSFPASDDLTWSLRGDMVGALPGLEVDGQGLTVRAATNCRALAIPRSTLQAKLQDDAMFAAHLYRARAMQLSNQLTHLTQQLTETTGQPTFQQPQRDSTTLFAALQDDDLDWLMAAGQVQQIAAETILVQNGRPIDAWYILLEGAVALHAAPEDTNPLISAFTDLTSQPEPEVARLSRGDTIGEMSFLHANLATVTATAVRETQVLSIPRWRLAAKLLHDSGFAARFYQVLTVLLMSQQQAMVQHYTGHSTNQAFDSQFLTRVALAEARFAWLLKRIQTQVPVGGGVKW